MSGGEFVFVELDGGWHCSAVDKDGKEVCYHYLSAGQDLGVALDAVICGAMGLDYCLGHGPTPQFTCEDKEN